MKPSSFLLNFFLFVFMPALAIAAATDYYAMTANYEMRSNYGPRSVGGAASSCHGGLDLRNKRGAGVPFQMFSMNSGKVNVINSGCAAGSGNLENRCGGGYGNYLTVTSDCGAFRTLYAHADGINVANGSTVEAGRTPIAAYNTAKGTGTSTGLHTHFETHVKIGGVWRKVDPQLIEQMIFRENKNPCNSGFAEEALNRSRAQAGKECMRARDTSKIADAGVSVNTGIGQTVNQITGADTGTIASYTNPGTSTVTDDGRTGGDPEDPSSSTNNGSTCNPEIMNAAGYTQAANKALGVLTAMQKMNFVASLIKALACPDMMMKTSQSQVMPIFTQQQGSMLSGVSGLSLSSITSSLSSLSGLMGGAGGVASLGSGFSGILNAGTIANMMSGASCAARNMGLINSIASSGSGQ